MSGEMAPTQRGERIHPWQCPACGSERAPSHIYNLAIYVCVECGMSVPIDEVGPED